MCFKFPKKIQSYFFLSLQKNQNSRFFGLLELVDIVDNIGQILIFTF
eukprot:UN01094